MDVVFRIRHRDRDDEWVPGVLVGTDVNTHMGLVAAGDGSIQRMHLTEVRVVVEPIQP